MTALHTLRRAHDRLVICATTNTDWALVREMDAAIEEVAKASTKHAAELIALISHPRIRFAPPSEGLIAANGYGEMPHPVSGDEE